MPGEHRQLLDLAFALPLVAASYGVADAESDVRPKNDLAGFAVAIRVDLRSCSTEHRRFFLSRRP